MVARIEVWVKSTKKPVLSKLKRYDNVLFSQKFSFSLFNRKGEEKRERTVHFGTFHDSIKFIYRTELMCMVK